MPMMQTTLAGMNAAFSATGLPNTVKNKANFAPGKLLHEALAAHGATPGTVLHRKLKSHLASLPGAVSETLRATIHHALSTKPPTHVTFGWAPGYDHEVTVWQAPDTKNTKGGITVLVKSRYPDDKHPLKKKPAAG